MIPTRNLLVVLLGIAAAWCADKDKDQFRPGSVSDYPSRQTISKVTIAVQAFESEEQARSAFGKNYPNKYGVLPVLVVMQNDSGQVINLEHMKVEYVLPTRQRAEATPASEVQYLWTPSKPRIIPGPIPTKTQTSSKKNPLAGWEIEGRAFAAKMLPPSDSASGFFYFQVVPRAGVIIHISGLREAATGKELFFFEIPLESSPR